ncbi:colicin immunity protein [Burkholderia ubonensis]|uniref:colicin immunity protein n=1 Tax=Burkholderia ubonensis TaxID=101571 RepID=UPI002AB56D06|nr:colicin immunity protein [Burkholderia ubonensis]MDY7787563.1 colicin immunity protein [Burkholderia ubonensis]
MADIDHQRRYDSPADFFALNGSIVMKLTADAAIAVCEQAAERGRVIARVEGGIWHSPGFEARVDCIWDGIDPPVDVQPSEKNNLAAIQFIRAERARHDVFILTAPRLSGW